MQAKQLIKSASWWRIPLLIIIGMITAKLINQISFFIANKVYPHLYIFDPDKVFIYISIHHIAQLGITLMIILIWTALRPDISFRSVGFNFHQYKFNLKWVLIFALMWFIIQFSAGYLITRNGISADPGYPLTTRNIIGIYAFQFLLSGTSEETMYRGLIMSLMLIAWEPLFDKDWKSGLVAIAGSTLVFMFDHVNFSIFPLAITYFNLLQQVTVLVFGFFYGFLYWKTRSLFGAILGHGLLNVIIISSGFLLFKMFG
jgi:membrane protease YdiL (CAAX protease family)